MQIGALILYLIVLTMGIFFSLIGSQKVLAVIIFGSIIYSRIAECYNIKIYDIRIGLEVIFIIFILLINFRRIRVNVIELIATALLTVMTMAGMFNYLNVNSLEIFINGFLAAIFTYFVAKIFASKAGIVGKTSSILEYAGLLTFLYALVQPLINGNTTEYFHVRASSFYYSPTIFGSVAILLLPFILNNHRSTIIKIIYAIVGMVAILLSGSRGAIILMVTQIGMSLKMSINKIGQMNKIKYVSRVVIFGCSIIYIFHDELAFLLRRFNDVDISSQGSSLSERIIGIKGAIELMSSSPIFGVGLGGFENFFKNTKASSMGELELMHAHNFILNVGAEQGLIAMFITILIMAGLIQGWVLKLKATERVGDFSQIQDATSYLFAILSYTLYIVLFGGEYLHKMSATPMIIYAVIAGLGRIK